MEATPVNVSTAFTVIITLIEPVCQMFEEYDFCDNALHILAPPFYHNFFYKEFNPRRNCGRIGLCPWNYKKDMDPINKILKEKPPTVHPQINNSHSYMKFLVFNDIHADPLYMPNMEVTCVEPVCCRVGNQHVSNGEGSWLWGTPGFCDLPYKTLDNFLDHATDHMMVDSLLWLGDNPGHNVWEQHNENHLEIIEHITDILSKKLPYLGQVYPVLGNHEGYPSDQFDLYSNQHKWIYEKCAKIWKIWLTNESYESMRLYGRYHQLHPNTNLRMIAINPFTYDFLNSFIWNNSTDPQGDLQWLEETLLYAESRNESVFILGHIAPSTIECERSIIITQIGILDLMQQ